MAGYSVGSMMMKPASQSSRVGGTTRFAWQATLPRGSRRSTRRSQSPSRCSVCICSKTVVARRRQHAADDDVPDLAAGVAADDRDRPRGAHRATISRRAQATGRFPAAFVGSPHGRTDRSHLLQRHGQRPHARRSDRRRSVRDGSRGSPAARAPSSRPRRRYSRTSSGQSTGTRRRRRSKRQKIGDLRWADGYAFGTPVRFGNPAAQLKQYLDMAGGLWFEGALADKPVTAFTSAMYPYGGLRVDDPRPQQRLLPLGLRARASRLHRPRRG